MWGAKIVDKVFDRGYLKVTVAFSNGIDEQEFTEVYSVVNNTSLDASIKSKLSQLQDVEQLKTDLVLGEFKPLPVVDVDPVMRGI